MVKTNISEIFQNKIKVFIFPRRKSKIHIERKIYHKYQLHDFISEIKQLLVCSTIPYLSLLPEVIIIQEWGCLIHRKCMTSLILIDTIKLFPAEILPIYTPTSCVFIF